MADENNTNTPQSNGADSAGNDDLRSLIAGAIAEDAQARQEPAKPAAATQGSGGGNDSPGGGGADTGSGGQGGGDDSPAGGAGGGADAPGDQGKKEPEPKGEPGAGEGGEDTQEASGREPPGNWSAEDQNAFNTLPAEAKQPFLSMYKRMEAGFTRKLQRGSQLEKDYGEIDQEIFHPAQREVIQRWGKTVPEVIRAWHSVEMALCGPDQNLRDEVLAHLIHNYKGNPSDIAGKINRLRGFADTAGGDRAGAGGDRAGAGGNGAAAPADGGAGGPRIDPLLEARFSALENDVRGRYQREANDQIQTFANAKDKSGNLLHPFFSELEGEMGALAHFDKQRGKQPQLADLYERALWSNPSTRERQRQLDQAAAQRAAEEESRSKAERARRAASSVTGAPGGPGQTQLPAKERELREEIEHNIRTSAAAASGSGRV